MDDDDGEIGGGAVTCVAQGQGAFLVHAGALDEPCLVRLSSLFQRAAHLGQVAADLTYCSQLGEAIDLYSYAPIGPGSSRGLNYLLDRSPNAGWTTDGFNQELMKIRKQIVNQLDITDLTLHDVQNVMCEFSKYCRTVLGEGKPKTIYQAERGF